MHAKVRVMGKFLGEGVTLHRGRERESLGEARRDRDGRDGGGGWGGGGRVKAQRRTPGVQGNSVSVSFFSFRELQFKDFIYLFPLIWTYGEEGKEED